MKKPPNLTGRRFTHRRMKTFEIECGDVKGYVFARTEGRAFRQLVDVMREDERLAELAAFREVETVARGPKPMTPWFYQEPKSLYASK